MPFNADEFLAKHQAAQADASSTGGGFDADQFLQSHGVQTLPNKGQIQDGPSTAEAIGRGLSQGGTMRFGDELSAAASALASTPTDQALNRSYSERYALARDDIRNSNAQAANAHPVVSALSEIAGSIPLTVAGGAALKTAGIGNTIAQAGIQGGAYGLGGSKKDSVGEALQDTLTSGLLSVGIAGAFGLAARGFKVPSISSDASLSSSADELGNEIAKAAPKTSFDKEGNFVISYDKGMKDSFKIGKDMQAALANPDVQASISQELNAQPQNIKNLIQQTKQKIGPQFDRLLEQNGDATADLSKTFENAYKRIDSIYSKSDPAVEKTTSALRDYTKQVEDKLLSKSSDGTLASIPLSDVAAAQQELGNIVYQQKAFLKAGTKSVHGAAQTLFGGLADAFEKADLASGSGGELTNINNVYSSLYKMEANLPKGTTLKSLADPQNVGAAAKYAAFVEPFAKLNPEVRNALAPELHSYLSGDFQKALTKAQVMTMVTGRGAQSHNAAASILSIAGLEGATAQTVNSISNRLGSMMSPSSPSIPSAFPSLGDLGSKVMQGSVPAIGALSTDNSNAPSQSALRELK